MPDVKGGLLARKRNLAQYPNTGELRSYTPTLRDRARAGLLGDTRPTAERLRLTEGLLGSSELMGLADLTPAGLPMALQEAYRARDPQAAAMAVMPVPGARLAKGAAKKAIVRASKQRVPFQGAAPNRTEFSLVRFKAPQGDSERFARLEQKFNTDPRAYKELKKVAKKGEKVGRQWYDTEKLRERFQSVLGQEDGDAAWKEFMWLAGATSPGSAVPENIGNASFYFTQGQKKLRALADDLISGKTLLTGKGSGYGHLAQKTHSRNVGLLYKGEWGPNADPRLGTKPRGFAQSLMGSERNMAADRHFMRLMGMASDDPAFLHGGAEISEGLAKSLRKKYGKKIEPYLKTNPYKTATGEVKQRINFNAKKAVKEGPKDLYQTIKGEARVWDDMPGANEYGALERLTTKMAHDMNMTPAQFQASLWMGAAKETGVDPASLDTFVNLFNQRVAQKAKERGRTETDVFNRFATRKEALAVPLGLLGAGVGGGLLNQQD